MVSKITYDTCLCCGSNAVAKVLECKDHTVSKEEFEIWECSNCTFRFTQNVPTEENIAPYYKTAEYVSHTDTKQGLINRLYHIVRKHTLQSKRKLVQKVTGLQSGSLLDVGAGTGAFANTMFKAQWKVTGLEPDATARANASSSYNLKLHDLTQLHQLESNLFDAITMWHVLEHVHDLYASLETYRRILKPNGRLIIAVPNYTSYDAAVYKEYWAAYDVPRHLYHFSPPSITILLEQKGLALKAVKPMWFDSFYVSMLSEKYRNGKGNFLRAVVVGVISNLKAIFNVRNCSSVVYEISKK
jgi:2-polyprenyl-3-methyl-5-hydroxy-6-metoxy-1,4-benzoquinol methylase